MIRYTTPTSLDAAGPAVDAQSRHYYYPTRATENS